MKYLKFKDNKLRHLFKKIELQLKLKNFVYKNILSFYYNKKRSLHNLISFQILKKKKKNISTKIVNRCILTNRSKSVRQLKISRIKAREFFSFGIFPGFKKAVW